MGPSDYCIKGDEWHGEKGLWINKLRFYAQNVHAQSLRGNPTHFNGPFHTLDPSPSGLHFCWTSQCLASSTTIAITRSLSLLMPHHCKASVHQCMRYALIPMCKWGQGG